MSCSADYYFVFWSGSADYYFVWNVRYTPESFGPIEGDKWSDQISRQFPDKMAASLKGKRTPITTPPYQVPSVNVTPDPPIFSLVTTFK